MTYILPDAGSNELPDPRIIYDQLCKMPEHEHLAQFKPDVAFMFREGDWVTKHRTVLGMTYMPQDGIRGGLGLLFQWLLERQLGYEPIFLFVLNANYWRRASNLEREILVFHEMAHAAIDVDQYGAQRMNRITGEPVWCIRAHDLEEFNSVVARYGDHAPDVMAFLAAAEVGKKTIAEVRNALELTKSGTGTRPARGEAQADGQNRDS